MKTEMPRAIIQLFQIHLDLMAAVAPRDLIERPCDKSY
jgi:hypothetical protein